MCCAPIGTGTAKMCAEPIARCAVRSHMKWRDDREYEETGPFLVVIKAKPKSKKSSLHLLSEPRLAVTGFAEEFVEELLEREDVDWAKEFEVIKSKGILDTSGEERTKKLILTVKKNKGAVGPDSTPGKQHLRYAEADSKEDEVGLLLEEHEKWELTTKEAREEWETAKEANDGSEAAGEKEKEARAAYQRVMDHRLDMMVYSIPIDLL